MAFLRGCMVGLLCVGGLFAFACFTPTTFLFRSVELTVHGNEPSQSMASDTDRAIVQMLIKAAKRGQRLKANASISSSGTHANEQDTASSGKRESLVLLHNDDLKRLSTEESISYRYRYVFGRSLSSVFSLFYQIFACPLFSGICDKLTDPRHVSGISRNSDKTRCDLG